MLVERPPLPEEAVMTLTCTKCGAEMTLKTRLIFAAGPAKLIYVCPKSANHVTVLEDPGVPAGD
mgnify:CR=1 FL=1